MSWYIYILQCSDGRLYTGVTTDVARREKEHQSGNGGHFTKAFGAQKVCHSETFGDKSAAYRREAQIKKWSRAKKLALIKGDKVLLKKA